MALVEKLSVASLALKKWKRLGCLSLSPRVVATRADEGDLSGDGFVVPQREDYEEEDEVSSALEESTALETDRVWEDMMLTRRGEVFARVRSAALFGRSKKKSKRKRSRDSNFPPSSNAEVALSNLAGALRRRDAAEAARRAAAGAMRERGDAISRKFEDCVALATFDSGKVVANVASLQEKERSLEKELRRLQAQTDGLEVTLAEKKLLLSRAAPTDEGERRKKKTRDLSALQKKGDRLATLVETLGGARVCFCSEAQTTIEVQLELIDGASDNSGAVSFSIALDSSTLALTYAHLHHVIVDVTDLMVAAKQEAPPNDLRFIVRETKARLRRLATRRRHNDLLADQLQALGLKLHADEFGVRLTCLAKTWTALLTLPDHFPDHPPGATSRLDTLSVVALHANVDHLRRNADSLLKNGNAIFDTLLQLNDAVTNNNTRQRKKTAALFARAAATAE